MSTTILLLRKQAEFENYRKRISKEKTDLRRSVESELLGEILLVLDSCELGLETMRGEESVKSSSSYLEGYELLLKRLHSLLDKYDVREIPAVGSLFDPNFHEAVVREVSEDREENEIVEEYRKGYSIGDRLLRAAQVKVSVWPDD